MIGKHCGQSLITRTSNPVYFIKMCVVCKKRFKQRKRLAKKGK